jgi:hypothetical protein
MTAPHTQCHQLQLTLGPYDTLLFVTGCQLKFRQVNSCVSFKLTDHNIKWATNQMFFFYVSGRINFVTSRWNI